MKPLSLEIIGGALSDLLSRAVLRVGRGRPDGEDLSRHLPETFWLADRAHRLVFDSAQLADIGEFLQDDALGALTQAYFVSAVAVMKTAAPPAGVVVAGGAPEPPPGPDPAVAKVAGQFGGAFEAMATAWCGRTGSTWHRSAADLWQLLVAGMDTAVPTAEVVWRLSEEEWTALAGYAGEPTILATGTAASPRPPFVQEILDIVADPERTTAVLADCQHVRQASVGRYADLGLQHSYYVNHRVELDRMYVDRDLVDPRDQSRVSAAQVLGASSFRARCVVTGDPGVGKSTLVQHVILSLARSPDPKASVPMLLRCRDYRTTAETTSIRAALAARLHIELAMDITEARLSEILSLGRALVIFDGLDEIVDATDRREFVARIEAFARRYPLAEVLVTSRRRSYEYVPLDPASFTLYELPEFSDAQVDRYARRWFALVGGEPVRAESFLREADTLGGVQRNPLMLSLLCTLHRARGYIPRNRRHVYKECADLLFHRWDSMRHIDQPVDHREYGQALMKEIAIFVHTSPDTQSGVPRSRLMERIVGFFVHTAGVHRDTAEQRASSFLEFCADRAWLLSVVRVEEGEKRFAFVHRTFLEYFVAEAMVRRAPSPEAVADDMIAEFTRDPASVLPELMVPVGGSPPWPGWAPAHWSSWGTTTAWRWPG
jgi:hypothetical protein